MIYNYPKVNNMDNYERTRKMGYVKCDRISDICNFECSISY